jgi:hypothetical protein
MARRPDDVDPETWKAQRASYWRRVNRFWNVLMLVAIVVVVARWLGWLPGFH